MTSPPLMGESVFLNSNVCMFQALYDGYSVDYIHDLTAIDHWFLHKLKKIVTMEKDLQSFNK